jgi:hypothetical protein
MAAAGPEKPSLEGTLLYPDPAIFILDSVPSASLTLRDYSKVVVRRKRSQSRKKRFQISGQDFWDSLEVPCRHCEPAGPSFAPSPYPF